MMSSYGIFPLTQQMAPLIDDSELAKPLTLKLDEPASIVVRISGFPKPTVRWQVGRKRVKESPKFHTLTDGDRTHILEVSRVTRDLEQGVWVVATNSNGEDCCLIEVRTYEIVLKPRHFSMEQQSTQRSRIVNRAGSLQRLGSFSNSSAVVKRGGSILSLKEWKQEMAIRNKMRSVDDLAFTSDKASLMSGLGYSLSVDVGDSDDPDLDEQFHTLSRHRPMPVATTRLVFAEVEPSRLVPVPNRSTANASRSEGESTTEEKIIAHPKQIEDQCAKESSKRNKRKVKKSVKKSTSTPGLSILETIQVEAEHFVSADRGLSDLPEGPRVTNEEDVWSLHGEKLADVCQKMLQMFPEGRMQTVDLKNIPIRDTFEERDIANRGIKHLNGCVRVKQSKANKVIDMQTNPEVKIDKEETAKDKVKNKNRRMLESEGKSNRDDDELLVNESLVDDLSANQRRLNSLFHEVKQMERRSNDRLRKGSTKRRNKRKIHSRSLSEFSQETTDFARQDNQTDVRREEQYDENYNVITVFEESAGLTARQRAKQKKIGNRRSLEFVAKEMKTQKKTKALKKSRSEAGQSGQMEYRAITPVEHETNRTLGENEAVVAVRAFAEIESRTSELVENEVSTSNMPDNGNTSKQAKTNSSTDIEAGLQGQKESLEVVKHEIKSHKKIQKTPVKVNRLSKRKQNITIISKEISILSENDLPDSNKSRRSFSSKLLADANNCENPDALVVKEITDNSESAATSAEIEHTCRVNLKPVVKKKRKKQNTSIKEIQDISFVKTGAVDSKKDLGFLGDLEDHQDLEHCEMFRDSKDLGNSKHLEDSRVLSEEETIVKMDREPRCGVRRPGGANETFNEVLERDWEKIDESLANTSRNKTNTPVQVDNKVENDTVVVMEGIISSEKKDVEEQIIVMDREPRGRNTWLNRNIDSANEESPDGRPKCKNAQTQEVSIRNIVADNGQKSLYGANNNVLQAEKSGKYRAAASATENSNAVNNFEAESSYITKPDFKDTSANNGHMATTFQKEHNQDADAFDKPIRQVINPEVVGTKHKKKPNRRDTGNAVESISSDECSGELFQSANSSSHQSTASKQRDARTSNVHLQEKESNRRSLSASVHLEIQTNDPALRAAPNSEQDIKTPNPLKSSTNLNSIAKNTGLRIQDSANNVQVSSSCTVDAVQHRLPQVTSPVGRLNSAMDQDKTDSDMTNEHTLILKALAERIRCGQVEIIVVNKMSTEEKTICPATPSKTLPLGLSANLTTLLNAHDTSEKVDESKPPMLTTIEEAPRSTTKHNEIKFIDSDESVDILEAGDQVSKPTDNLGTVENKTHIGSSVIKVDLPENRTGLPGITVGIPVTKLDLPATTSHLSATRVDLLGTIPYLPGTKVDMPGTKVELSGTMIDLSETNSYVPETNQSGTNQQNTNRQKSHMQNGQPPGTLVGVQDNILPVGPLVRENIATNMTSERNSAPTVISCVNKTTENTMGINTAESKIRSSRNTELESRPNLKETFLEMLPQTMSNPSEIRKSNSVKVGIMKLEPPKPKPRNSISDGKSEKLHQNSTKPSAIAPTIIRTQRKLTDPSAESKDETEIPTWRIKPTLMTNLHIQQKPANDANESNDAKVFEGRLAMQKQPQPIGLPRTKLSTIKRSSWTKLSSDFATSPTVSEDKSSHRPNRQELSERSDLRPVAATEANAKTTFPVPHMQVLSDESASLSTDKYCSVATQVTTSDNEESLSSDTTTIAVENVSKTTQVATSPILKSSTATQTTTAPVGKSSTATQITPVSDQKPLLTSTLPCDNSGTYTPSNIALRYRPIIGNRFAKSITPSVINYDRNSYVLGHSYTPFTRYVSSPQHSWWNVYQRKLVPDYARETGLLRHQITRPQDDHTETSEKRLDSQEIEKTPQSFASYKSGQLRNSTVTTQVDFSEINQDVIKDQKSLEQYQHSKQQEISEQAESVQNTVDVKPETSTLMPRLSLLPSTNGHLLEEPNRDGEKVAEMNDADLGWEQSNSSIRVCNVEDLESSVSTKTEDAVIEGSGFETSNNNKKGTGKCESSTEKKKEQYVSTMVTHEYGEVIVLYPAT